MLDVLDDDGGFEPDAAFRAGVLRRGRALRRRRRSLAAGAVVAPVVAMAGAVAWTGDRLADVDRVDVEVGGPPPMADGAPTEPVDVLVVGTDRGLHGTTGDPAGARADAVALVRLDPAVGEVRVLSLPRDLLVGGAPDDVDGTRLSQVRADGGPGALREVADALLAAGDSGDDRVDSYVELDPEGLAELADLAGGVALEVERPVRDDGAGLSLDAGCHDLGGDDLLALVRARRVQVLIDGRWVSDPRSDDGRVARTQLVGRALADAVLEAHPTPTSVASLLDVLGDHLTLDVETEVDELASLARWARTLPADAVTVATLPTDPAVTAEGASVLVRAADADAALRWLVAGGALPSPGARTVPATPGPETALTLPLSGACP